MITETINEAYNKILKLILTDFKFETSPHGKESNGYFPNSGEIQEILGAQIWITNPEDNLVYKTKDPKRDSQVNKHNQREIEVFDAGFIDSNIMAHHSTIWKLIENKSNQTINANYGYMVHHLRDTPDGISQFEWAYRRLIEDKDTRQSYMHFNRVKDQYEGNNDQPCTVYCQFIIRDNFLYLFSYMRSNDVMFGTPYNLGYFNHLSKRMFTLLKKHYPELTGRQLVHNATSLHMYKRHLKRVEKMVYGNDIKTLASQISRTKEKL